MPRNRLLTAAAILFATGCWQPSRADMLRLDCGECALGTGSYAGGSSPLTYALSIQGMTWGPMNGYFILGSLNLQTGNLTAGNSSGWSFGSGGSFTLVGTILDVSDFHQVLSTRTLLTGSVISASVPTAYFNSGFDEINASISVTADTAALALLGLPEGGYTGTFWAMFENPQAPTVPAPPAAFSITQSHEAGIRLDPVPEPSTAFLLATTLGASGMLVRRARRDSKSRGV